MKNSGTFRSDQGADAFLDLLSIVETTKKHNNSPYASYPGFVLSTDNCYMVIAEYLQGIKLGLIFINFKVYAKISFQLLSSNKKIMRTFAIGLLDFSSICHS